MKWWLALAVSFVGCAADCPPSGDIQVMVVPAPGVDPSSITVLRLVLSVNGAPAHTVDLQPPHRLDGPSAVLLRPDPPPADKYNVSLTVEALDAGGALVEVGGTAGDVVARGCNRLEARLATLPGPVDALISDGTFADLGGIDLQCAGGPDEDADGRPNGCDLCPADYDPAPIDTDGDGLPDACDPDLTRPGNRLLYFEPFDVNSGHWSGTFQVSNSFLDIQTQADDRPEVSTNGLDSLPANVRAQMFVVAPVFEGPTANFASDAGLFLGSNSNPGGPTTSGMLCTINHTPGAQDTVDLNVVANGMLQPPVQQPFLFGTGTLYRVRLTQHGATYTCEVVANGFPTTTVTTTVAQAPAAPQFLALHAWHIEAQFHSVVAESVLP